MATKTSSRPRLSFLIAAAFALSASVMPTKVKAADVYYDGQVGGYPSSWSTVGNWWTDALRSAAAFPVSGDNLFFGYASSGARNERFVNDIGATLSFNSINFTDLDGWAPRYLSNNSLLSANSIVTNAGSSNVIVGSNGGVLLTGTAPLITTGAGSSIDFGAFNTLTASTGLTVSGAGNTTIAGNLLVNGLEKIGTGTLALGNGSYFMSSLDPIDVLGGTLNFTQSGVQVDALVNNDSLVNFTSTSGAAGVSFLTGSGTTDFSGDAWVSSFSGTGTLNLNGNSTILSLSGNADVTIAATKTLEIASGSFSGTLQGDGSLSKSGPGTLLMNGLAADDYTGTTTVIDGTLQFDSGVTLAGQVTNDYYLYFTASAGVTTLATGLGGSGYTRFWGDAVIGQRSGSGLLELAGNTTITTLNGTGTVDFSAVPITLQVANGNYAGQFVGASSLDKFSGGTLVLSGFSNSFSGDVNVYNGTIEARSDRALGTGVVRLDGGNLAITGDSAWLLGNNVTQIGSAFVTLGAATVGATAVTQSLGNLGMWNGSSLIVQQNGSFAAGAPATLSVGTVTLDGPFAYNFNVGSGAKLEVRGAVNGSANNDLFVVGAGDTTISGNLNLGSGDLLKYGSGTLRLLSANTFSGNVDVFGGTLVTASNGLQNVPQIYVHAFGTLNGVNYKTDADLAIDQFGTATFSAAASAITGTIWNNGNLTLNPALGGNSTITLNEFYGSGTTTITRGNLTIYNNALTLGPSVLDPFTYDNTLPADRTWGYGAGGGGLNSLTLIGTLTADISGGTVNTTNLFANYIFDVDMLGDRLNATSGRPLGIAGPSMGGTNVFLNVNVSGSATVGTIAVDGTGTVNFAGTAEVVTLENGRVNLTGTLGEFTNVLGGVITSTSADVKITHLTGGTHSFNGQSTTITNFTGGTAALNGVQSLVTTFGGTAAATATSNITVGTMSGGSLTLQGSGPSSFITRLSGGTLNINGSDVLVTVNAGNSPAIVAGADIIGNGSDRKSVV
jgi:autotransporter-associated beta strand protein